MTSPANPPEIKILKHPPESETFPAPPPHRNPAHPPSLEALNITKHFGPLVALDSVSLKLPPGTFHALLGGNGAGKSTLVKCIMGFYHADQGQILVNDSVVDIKNPKDALALSIGMVYQHFTLVDNMTVAENLVLSRGTMPFAINWDKEITELRTFLKTTPFFIPLNSKVGNLAAGQKQKLEIVKQIYLKNKIIFLDEPTSVLTPQESDEVLGMLKQKTLDKELSVIIITHKFSQVMKFADQTTILRNGKFVGGGKVADLDPHKMAELMIGNQQTATLAARSNGMAHTPQLVIKNLSANDDAGTPAIESLNLSVTAGEVVGIVGVSGNGQSELVEVLGGQRVPTAGKMIVKEKPYTGKRKQIQAHRMYTLPEEPLRNACVPTMSVGSNLALRNFDKAPFTIGKTFLNPNALKRAAVDLIARYRVKTPSHSTPIRNLSGGNVQRAVLARELSGNVEVLVVQNPCFGLDFAATADIRAQIMDARNRGAAVLLVTEDLDEAFELSDRIIVMFEGKFVYETPIDKAEISTIGRHMAGGGGHAHDRTAPVELH